MALNSFRTELQWHMEPQEKTLQGFSRTLWMLEREKHLLRQVPLLWGVDIRLGSPWSV